MEKYRIVILGAGISGLSLSLFLKKHNINDFIVLNSTNKSFHKACTGILVNKTVSILKDIGIELNGYEKVSKVTSVFNNQIENDYSQSGLFLYHHKDGGRTSLDNALRDKCGALNVNIIDNCGKIVIDNKKRLIDFNNKKIQYDFLVDGSGFYNDSYLTKNKDIGFECKVEHQHKKIEKTVKIVLNSNLKGYGWIIYGPNSDIIGFVDEYKNNVDYKSKLNEFINVNYEDNIKLSDQKGAFIPIKPSKLLVNNSHINLGDKAGLVDPLTQEGIYFAILSAKYASEALEKNNLKLYKKLMEPIVANFNFANKLRKVFFNESYQNKLWNFAVKHSFPHYIFNRYSNDEEFFDYRKIFKYRKEYRESKNRI